MLSKNIKIISDYKVFFAGVAFLASIFVIHIIANYQVDYSTTFFVIAFVMFGLSIWQVHKESIRGTHAIAWIFFLAYAAMYATGEIFWTLCDSTSLDTCFTAEIIWVAGYVPLITFFVLYIKPFSSAITKKHVIVSSVISVLFLASSFIIIHDNVLEEKDAERLIPHLYVAFDTILIVPVMLGLGLFFRGRVSFAWTLLLLGVLSMTVADYSYYFANHGGSEMFDDWQNVFYVGEYTMFSLGLYYRSRKSSKDRFQNQESFR